MLPLIACAGERWTLIIDVLIMCSLKAGYNLTGATPYCLQAFKPWKAKAEEVPVLFDRQLLEFGRELKDNVSRTPINGFAKTLWARLLANGCDPGIQLDTLRKLWGRALDEYSIVDTRLLDLTTHGLPERGHVTQLCAFCAGSQEHLHKIKDERAASCTAAGGATFSNMPGAAAAGAAAAGAAAAGAAPQAAAAAQGDAALAAGAAATAQAEANETAQTEWAMPAAFAPLDGAATPQLMHAVYGDAHFGCNHLAGAGSATTHGPALVGRTLPDQLVRDFANLTTSSTLGPASEPQACADRNFSADKVAAKHSKRNDVTGVAALFCRHAFLLVLLNMPTGAIALLLTCVRVLHCSTCSSLRFWPCLQGSAGRT